MDLPFSQHNRGQARWLALFVYHNTRQWASGEFAHFVLGEIRSSQIGYLTT